MTSFMESSAELGELVILLAMFIYLFAGSEQRAGTPNVGRERIERVQPFFHTRDNNCHACNCIELRRCVKVEMAVLDSRPC